MHRYGKISDLEARKIASEWHGGQGTALYEFSSTGTIAVDLDREITTCARSVHNDPDNTGADFTNLIELRTYIQRHGPRGPVDGWSTLSW